MGLLDGLEKLINEHGSAAILKERIELANDKYAALEKKLEAAELKIKGLESDSQRFELETFKLKEQIRTLEEQLAERNGQRLEEVREQMLQLLAAQSQHIMASQIADALKIGEQLATYHLTEMLDATLVHAAYAINRPPSYAIAQAGRAYLVSHGLLK